MTDSEVRAHPVPSTSSDGLRPPPDADEPDGTDTYAGMDNGETGEDTGYPAAVSRGADGAPSHDMSDVDRPDSLEAIGHPLVDDPEVSAEDTPERDPDAATGGSSRSKEVPP